MLDLFARVVMRVYFIGLILSKNLKCLALKAKQNKTKKKNRKSRRTVFATHAKEKRQSRIVSAAEDAIAFDIGAKILKKISRTFGVGDWSSGGNKTKFNVEQTV